MLARPKGWWLVSWEYSDVLTFPGIIASWWLNKPLWWELILHTRQLSWFGGSTRLSSSAPWLNPWCELENLKVELRRAVQPDCFHLHQRCWGSTFTTLLEQLCHVTAIFRIHILYSVWNHYFFGDRGNGWNSSGWSLILKLMQTLI